MNYKKGIYECEFITHVNFKERLFSIRNTISAE